MKSTRSFLLLRAWPIGIFLFCLGLAPCAQTLASDGIDLQALMAVPIASQLTADVSRTRLAWVVNAAGHRSVQVAQAPGWEARPIATFADDGLELGDLVWAHDGRAVYFTRGADLPGRGTNAALDPLPAQQSVWRADVSLNEPARVLFEGRLPAVSPSGRLAFVRAGALYLSAADGSEVTQVVRDNGRVDVPRWSPDGKSIAFVSARGLHAFIGVYEVERRQLRYLEPSADTDSDPVWSPDSTRIAFMRSPAEGEFRHVRRAGEPFSIRVAEAASGVGSERWRADRGDGSYFSRLHGGKQIAWRGETLIFPWEKDGWRRLYALPIGDGSPQPLTPAEGEVDSVAVGDDEILYSSNHGQPERRAVWSAGSGSAASPQRITPTSLNAFRPVRLAERAALAYLATDARGPARVVIQSADGRVRQLGPAPAMNPPGHRLSEPVAVSFAATDGWKGHGLLFEPASARAAGKRPALIYLHGGPKDQMLLGYHPELYYSHAYSLIQHLVSRGFVVLAVNFRGGTGYGLQFRETPDYGQYGASDMRDISGAANYLRARAQVDAARLGIWGGSYGGMMTQLALARASDVFAAGVSIHGVYDMRDQSRAHDPLFAFMHAYDPDNRAMHKNRMIYESSAAADVHRWRSPVLLIHGDDDRSVPFFNMVRMVEALRRNNVEFEQLVLPNEAHSFLLYRSWLQVSRATAQFLERRLK